MIPAGGINNRPSLPTYGHKELILKKTSQLLHGVCGTNSQTKTHGVLAGFAVLLLAAIFTFTGCPTDPDDEPDTRVELTAGVAVNVAVTATTANVTFTGATGLTLAAAEFAVSAGGTISKVAVASDTATVSVTFGANTTAITAKTYTVSIASDSTKIKGSGTVVITQAGSTADKATLTIAINTANTAQVSAKVDTNAANVPSGTKWVTQAEMTALTSGITAAQTVANKANATTEEIANAITTLNAAIATFNTAKKEGAKIVDPITTTEALFSYLKELTTSTAGNPHTVPLTLAFNTGSVASLEVPWADINSAVAVSGKYVILDLSACTAANGMTGNTIAGSESDPSANAFNIIAKNTYIKGVTLPATLTSIGTFTFKGCTGLTSVTIPGSVTSIGASAFYGCTGLKSLTIPGSVTSIGASAFSACTGLTGVTIPARVTSIGASAFSACTGLTSVTIGEGVTSIGASAFSACTGLTSVTIPGSVKTIGASAFSGCSGLTAFTVAESNTAYSTQDGILYNKAKTTVIQVPRAKSGALNLPDTLTSIGANAFSDCSGLTSVTIPGSVTSIGNEAFSGCTGLTSVIFGAGSDITTQWNSNTFSGSSTASGTRLWNAYSSGTKPGTYTRYGDMWTQEGTAIAELTAYLATLPTGSAESPTTTKPLAFAFNTSSLSSGQIPLPGAGGTSGVTSSLSSGQIAWEDINMAIANSGKYVILDLSACTAAHGTTANTIAGSNLYSSNNTYIKGITLPSTLTSIGNAAFYGYSGLTSVTIPEGVTSIGANAFSACTGLTSVIFGAGSDITTAWNTSTFNNGTSLWTVYNNGSKPGTYTYIIYEDYKYYYWTQVK
jgi:hypothetical protein